MLSGHFCLTGLCAVQMIPSVRAFLSTSWDPKIRQALAKKNREMTEAAAKTMTKESQTAATGISRKDIPVGTATGGNEVKGTGERGTA